MKIENYVALWVLLLSIITAEYISLHFAPQFSVLRFILEKQDFLEEFNLSTEPGRPISLALGYAGFGIMLLTNIYSVRKRLGVLSSAGKLSGWLDFHIFCGLVGPTLILFHSDFKIRGLVAISFWSMVVSFSSGIVGRYFYVQTLRKKSDIDEEAEKWSGIFEQHHLKYAATVSAEDVLAAKTRALAFVGAQESDSTPGIISTIFSTTLGDLRLFVAMPKVPSGFPEKSRSVLLEYALLKRRTLFLDSFNQIMGYWHAFHFPFAVFMYITAVIHIVAALMFGVSK